MKISVEIRFLGPQGSTLGASKGDRCLAFTGGEIVVTSRALVFARDTRYRRLSICRWRIPQSLEELAKFSSQIRFEVNAMALP